MESYLEGYRISVSDLNLVLRRISHDNHQWHCQPVLQYLERKGERRRYVAIGYSNPHLGALPNSLIYLFPVVAEPMPGNDLTEPLICLHPQLATTLREGLYFEDDNVKRDLLQDWDSFWLPIEAGLT